MKSIVNLIKNPKIIVPVLVVGVGAAVVFVAKRLSEKDEMPFEPGDVCE